MKFLKIIFFFLFSITIFASVKSLGEIQTLVINIEETTYINKKVKTSEYILKFVKPNKIRKEIISPDLNKGEIYIYKNNEKIVYLPLFEQVTKEEVNSDENDVVNAINYILDIETKDSKLSKEYYSGKLKTLTLENGNKIGIGKLIKIDGYLLPQDCTIYDGDLEIAKLKIKEYKNNVDVLTLSATPIPRTLQMSIAVIRSLSLIETPPVDRYPIQTYVLAENKQIIKDAIYKELARGGQVFVLYNRVENIDIEQAELQRLVPEAKIGVAHGQMNKNDLEQIMMDFTEKKYDVLLCTTIIETGIDIESANTLIIIDADHFGLSQLYQIRGRIGRSNKIAYCYLMYAPNKVLSEIATKRLKVIKDFTELGSGFAIAMRDLSIRGAGDILGSEQAGFIDSIGIELFMQMLNEEVAKLKGETPKEEETKDTPPLIDVATSINDSFVSDEDLKIEIHKKICSIDSYESLNEVKQELEDRFGKLSDDLIIYMHEELFEKEAQELNVQNIRQTKNSIEITLDKDLTNKIDGETLFFETSNLSRMFRFSMKFGRLVITLDTIKLDKHFVYYLLDFLKILKKSIKEEK